MDKVFLLKRIMLLCALLVVVPACSQIPAEIVHYSQSVFDSKFVAKYVSGKYWDSGNHKQSGDVKTSSGGSEHATKTILVKKGDSVSKIAQHYGMSSGEIIKLNKLRKPYEIMVGQKLVLPAYKLYKVKKGDFVSKIAKNYHLSTQDIISANHLKKPYEIMVGQTLRVPYVGKSVKVASHPHSKKATSKKYSAKKKKASAKKTRVARHTAKTKSKKYAQSHSKKRSLGRFLWPTRGKIISKFGSNRMGEFNDGINISAREGMKIHASENGTVVYTGNELKGYGNLLIIRHSGGWLTAYAHQKNFILKKGDKVKKGQIIGYVGKTGNVKSPQLHFAIRKGLEAVDPLKYLSS